MGFGREAKNLTTVKYVIVEKSNDGCRLDDSDERPRKNNKTIIYKLLLWNVLSLYGAETLKQLKTELEKYRIGIAAVQEIRCRGSGVSVGYRELRADVQCVVMKVTPLETVFSLAGIRNKQL